jgi:hypothetical protein
MASDPAAAQWRCGIHTHERPQGLRFVNRGRGGGVGVRLLITLDWRFFR